MSWAATDVHSQDTDEEPENPVEILVEQMAQGEGEGIEVELSPAVTRLLESPVLSDAQKQALRVMHGVWDDLNPEGLPIGLRARLAYLQGDLSTATEWISAEDLDANPHAAYWLARLHLAHGRLDDAQPLADRLDRNPPPTISGPAVDLLHGQIAEARGDSATATARLTPVRERFFHETSSDPAELTAAAQAIALLAKLEGRPASDYRRAISLLDTAVDTDPLYWPARLAQAELLHAKDNADQAGDALNETLALNPSNARAWALATHMAIDRWNFTGAGELIEHAEAFAPRHPALPTVAVRRAIIADELKTAEAVFDANPAHANQLEWPAWRAALAARRFDPDAVREHLNALDALAPGTPAGYATVADVLSTARQYDRARPYFEEAVRRQPNDAAPRLELGLMLMQLGDLPAARDELALAARLDPFHAGVNNSLDLVEDMITWPTVATEHFLIRHAPGPDAALARDLPPVLEKIRDDLADELGEAFGQTTHDHPHGPIQIDLLPDSQTFAVRVTGQSELGALAACTGDVLAMTPPRLGTAQTGIYHWADVIRHEYVHAIVFDLSNHLSTRWFHEGTATHFEQLERTYETQQMLAQALAKDELIPFEELEAAFGSPRIMFAYQQSGWMIEFLTETHGNPVLNTIMTVYGQSGDDADALLAATGQTPDEFMADFTAWAKKQAESWGLDARPMPEDIRTALNPPELGEANGQDEAPGDENADALANPEHDIPDEAMDAWIEADPDHPTLLRLVAQRALNDQDADDETIDTALRRYADARPADPWPRKQLAARALSRGDTDTALEVLAWLDQRELHDAQWAVALADLYRKQGDFDAAYDSMLSAIYRDPYFANFRETAAAIAIQNRDLEKAAFQIQALIDLEPNEPQHKKRLEAVQKLLGS